MTKAYSNALSATTPQSAPENELQTANNAGGYTFEVTDTARLERFLILGTDGGTYYVKEADLTKQNMDWYIKFVTASEDNARFALGAILGISSSGRAYRNSAAIFALALLFKHGPRELKSHLINTLPSVCRTGTHLFEFCGYVEQMGGWGRAKREAVANWYESKTDGQLAYQVVKYRQRNGWTHRDALRLSHPVVANNGRNVGVNPEIGNFILGKELGEIQNQTIYGFTAAQEATSPVEMLDVLEEFTTLPWEALPTQFLTEPEVWKKLFYNGQLQGQALVRNVVRLSRIGCFNDMVFARNYADKLVDEQMISRSRLHPIQYLNAMVTYTDGQLQRRGAGWSYYTHDRKKDWEVTPVIRDALNQGFYLAFKYVAPAGKRTLLALDISSSMGQAAVGIDLSCADVSAAMAMTIARSEPYYDVMAFNQQFTKLDISPGMTLDQVVNTTNNWTGGGTDCSVPMTWAANYNREVDTFIVLTDNETWAGNIHPHIALQRYRQSSGIDAKLVVVGMTATQFTIADPRDRGMLDVVGCDSNLPRLITEFSAGRI
jgi:60 kDa SS-A/Ro ribonucleoprotein